LHPTASGYDKLGDAWYQELVKRSSLSGVQNLTGSAYDDVLIGNAGANRIEGGAGDDLLTGGGSTDTLVYRSRNHGDDTITDFSNNDLFQISASGFGGGLVSGVSLSDGTASSTGVLVQGSSAVGSSANFLYYGGSLYFDVDGVGAQTAVKIAGLTGAPALTVNQFSIVA
jgi:Ca2+-binding RTX toxin-like protein